MVPIDESRRRLCAADEIDEKGCGFRFNITRENRVTPAFAIRYRGRVYAYLNQCAHQGVELDWQHGHFFDRDGDYLVCATHGALYHPHSGDCAYGRCAGRGLIPLKTLEQGNEILLLCDNGIDLLPG